LAGKILLTGGAGYIGSHTYLALFAAGYEVVIVDDFSNAQRDVIDRLEIITGAPVICYEGDILDTRLLDRVFADHAFAGVVHFAAKKAVGESMRIPLDYFHINCGGFLNLLKAMERAGVFRIVFSSSATVYGAPETLPAPETAPRGYTNPYGFTKLFGEQVLEQLAEADPRWTGGILRYFNPAGAHPSGLIGEDPNDIPGNLMPYIAKVATGELERLAVFGNDYDTPDGTGVRDYIHVTDLARGHVLSLGALMRGESHVVNLGTGKGYSVMEVLRAYEQACGHALPFVIAPRRPGDVAEVYADPARAHDLLGFLAENDLDDMCESSWHWISRRKNS
jgi:UDP-glucose 4-epimerase